MAADGNLKRFEKTWLERRRFSVAVKRSQKIYRFGKVYGNKIRSLWINLLGTLRKNRQQASLLGKFYFVSFKEILVMTLDPNNYLIKGDMNNSSSNYFLRAFDDLTLPFLHSTCWLWARKALYLAKSYVKCYVSIIFLCWDLWMVRMASFACFRNNFMQIRVGTG